MIFDLEDLKDHMSYIDAFNKVDLKDITLVQHGVPIKLDPAILEEWQFIGLSNVWFVREHLLNHDEKRLSANIDP